MNKTPLAFKYFSKCKSKELIRGNFGNGTYWAIYCRAGDRAHALILEGTERWKVMSLETDFGFDGPFDGTACMSYGEGYTILPNHAGLCEIDQRGLGSSRLLNTAGSFIYASSVDGELTSFLVANFDHRLVYLNLSSGVLQSEPGGFRATFASWTLWKDDMAAITPSVALISN